jgi:HAD superfamily hydrolase (TIGR01490 family)
VVDVSVTSSDAIPDEDAPVDLAVYDFDGTLLAGKSPVILTRHLFFSHSIKPLNLLLIGLWGLAYKMHVPPNEAWVRGRVFRAFEGKPQTEVDAYLARFYDEKIAHRLRPSMLEHIKRDREDGCVIVTVSATFEPIVRHMADLGVVDYEVATRMVVDGAGNYVARVDGLPVEGEEKLAALRRFADEKFGPGAWRIRRAYSDHYSDKPLLFAASEPTAVHPDTGLRKAAEKNGWQIIDS